MLLLLLMKIYKSWPVVVGGFPISSSSPPMFGWLYPKVYNTYRLLLIIVTTTTKKIFMKINIIKLQETPFLCFEASKQVKKSIFFLFPLPNQSKSITFFFSRYIFLIVIISRIHSTMIVDNDDKI